MKHVLKEQQAMALFLLKSPIYAAAEGLKQSGLCKLLAGRDALHSASRCLTELSGEVGCVGLACPGTCPPAPPGAVLASLICRDSTFGHMQPQGILKLYISITARRAMILIA